MYNLRGVFVALIVVAVEATKSEMLVDSTTVSVPCPLGFVAQGNGCVCADWPDGMVVCDKDSQRASMMVGYCMTYDNETSEGELGVASEATLEMIPTNSFTNFQQKYLNSIITCVGHLTAEAYCVESARKGLLVHLLPSMIVPNVQLLPMVG